MGMVTCRAAVADHKNNSCKVAGIIDLEARQLFHEALRALPRPESDATESFNPEYKRK